MDGAHHQKVTTEHFLFDLFIGLFCVWYAIVGSLGEALISTGICYMFHLSNRTVMAARVAVAKIADREAQKEAARQAAIEKEKAFKAKQKMASEKYFELSETS